MSLSAGDWVTLNKDCFWNGFDQPPTGIGQIIKRGMDGNYYVYFPESRHPRRPSGCWFIDLERLARVSPLMLLTYLDLPSIPEHLKEMSDSQLWEEREAQLWEEREAQ